MAALVMRELRVRRKLKLCRARARRPGPVAAAETAETESDSATTSAHVYSTVHFIITNIKGSNFCPLSRGGMVPVPSALNPRRSAGSSPRCAFASCRASSGSCASSPGRADWAPENEHGGSGEPGFLTVVIPFHVRRKGEGAHAVQRRKRPDSSTRLTDMHAPTEQGRRLVQSSPAIPRTAGYGSARRGTAAHILIDLLQILICGLVLRY